MELLMLFVIEVLRYLAKYGIESEMKVKECLKPEKPGVRFCKECGRKLTQGSPSCVRCGKCARLRRSRNICPASN
jgi:hypothetical protein